MYRLEKNRKENKRAKAEQAKVFFLNLVWNATTLYANREIYMHVVYIYIYRSKLRNNKQFTKHTHLKPNKNCKL